jgi:putative CocE/NonD family hydrolase
MGPWSHGQWSGEGSFLGNARFESNTAAYFQQNLIIPFFQYYLKGKGSATGIAEASIFFTGANQWKTFDQWPAKNVATKKLFIGDNSSLTFNSPATVSTATYDYISDPAKPVPYTEDVHFRRTREYMTDDQRFAARRPDVLTFVMDVQQEELTIAGPVIANIVTAISGTDADFVVKLIDVFPDNFSYPDSVKGNGKNYPMGGYQMLVRGEIMRGKFRNSFSVPEAFVPNKTTTVKFELPDVAHTFKKGHRLMIQVQSSWFPLADRNPQRFMDIYKATETDFQKATIKIHAGATGTYFTLPILK